MGELRDFVGANYDPDEATGDRSPILACLGDLFERFRADATGAVATYIPELAKANPEHFGVCIATLDGQIYELGDSRQPFTIQSVSKPFCYGLALCDQGSKAVLDRVGVEPSGDAFNSIVFDERSNRPFNPMVNAGAIATTSLIRGASHEERWERIMGMFARFAGRPLSVDEAVFRSEKLTGHRNRAIAYLELNAGMIEEPVVEHLDLYFRQCSILVDARDLAIMAATLANTGVNPLTGERALPACHVRSMLSVMQSCGMYDFSGEWGFRVGLPAKSGVGGGIIAVLPGQFGIGTFSPLLDPLGNSIRGVRFCEALAESFNLHVFDSHPTARSAIRRSYSGAKVRSKRLRRLDEQETLARIGGCVHVYELQGDLFFASIEQVVRKIDADLSRLSYVVLDGKRAARVDRSVWPVIVEVRARLDERGVTFLLAGFGADALAALTPEGEAPFPAEVVFASADEAIDWCECQLLAARDGRPVAASAIHALAGMDLAAGLSEAELAHLSEVVSLVAYGPGELIIREGDVADALYVLAAGSATVQVALHGTGKHRRLAAIGLGVTFGEIALFDGGTRLADVVAGPATACYVLPVARLKAITEASPELGMKLWLNVGRALSHRLRQANDEIRSLEG
ncbi:MAG: glutaminase A [Rhodospirillales bacterium]|nr:glutaminase A [Rhodospirillales bacterium]